MADFRKKKFNFALKYDGFWPGKIIFFIQSYNWRVIVWKNKYTISSKKTQIDRMIFYRVTAAANLKNVVLRKTRLKIKVLISLL